MKVRPKAIEVNRRYLAEMPKPAASLAGSRSAFVCVEHRALNIERPLEPMEKKLQSSETKDRIGVIDVIGRDAKTGEVVLVMNEPNEWDGSDEQLFALQERFNAYVSFLLDGEMGEAHPELGGKLARIELRCKHLPDSRALELLGLIHDQLAFQEIKMEVVVSDAAS